MNIDCHLHLLPNTEEGARAYTRSIVGAFLRMFLRRQLKMPRSETRDFKSIAHFYVNALSKWIDESELDRAVLLAFDQTYSRAGEPIKKLSSFHVSNEWAAQAASLHPNSYLWGASVHPNRKDALDELDRVASLGAVLIKLLPNTHAFDPADKRYVPYYKKLADLKMPLLIHGGYEHTLNVVDQSLGNPLRVRTALDNAATVIVAHAGSAGLSHPKETMGHFLSLVDSYENCFGDTAALGNWWRAKYIKQLVNPHCLERKYKVAPPEILNRLMHGSDYPVPITKFYFWPRMSPGDRRRLKRLHNPLQLDIELKRLSGLPDSCLELASKILRLKPNTTTQGEV